METQSLMTVGIGTKEAVKLQPKKCKVESVKDEFVEKAKATKAVFTLRHPDAEEPIKISSATIMKEKKGKKEIVSIATWFNLDQDKKLQKDCALAKLLKFYGANSVLEMVDKDVETEADTEGYLTIKAY